MADAEKKAAAPQGAQPKTQKTLGKFRAVKWDYYNPFTKARFVSNDVTEAEVDSWLQSQLDAGYIVRVE